MSQSVWEQSPHRYWLFPGRVVLLPGSTLRYRSITAHQQLLMIIRNIAQQNPKLLQEEDEDIGDERMCQMQ